jgi:hypothetical protein
MALRQLFQRLFDASSDSDIPKNVPFTLVINTLLHKANGYNAWKVSKFDLHDASRHALAGMGGQVEVRFRVGFSPLSQSDLRVFGPFEILVGH